MRDWNQSQQTEKTKQSKEISLPDESDHDVGSPKKKINVRISGRKQQLS
jgi:hypothetical protein